MEWFILMEHEMNHNVELSDCVLNFEKLYRGFDAACSGERTHARLGDNVEKT